MTIEKLTAAMLQHCVNQNIGIAVGAALNLLMTLGNYAPKELRGGFIAGLRNIADQIEAMDGVKS